MLSIIIPVFNFAKMTENCIDSIIQHTNYKYEIIVVDNGSSEEISDAYKNKVVFIKSDKNLLFSGGCNLGAKAAKYPYLCFLNNDTTVLREWDSALTYLKAHDTVGIVGVKLIYQDGTIQHAGVQVIGDSGFDGLFDHRYRGYPEHHLFVNRIREYQSVTAACVFITKKDFLDIEGFSEEYKNGYEDNDLCFKIMHNLNKKVVYFPGSTVIHLESKTRNKEGNPHHLENGKIFISKWKDKLVLDKNKWDIEDRS